MSTPDPKPRAVCPKCSLVSVDHRLRPHNCAERQKHPEKYNPTALAIATKIVAAQDDAAMGAQLTAAYHEACGAMPKVLRFGCMMMQLRAHLAGPTAQRGQLPEGRAAKDGGMAGWLEKHAPEVKRATAQRFEDVTRGIATEYAQIVGAKVAKTYDLPALVAADPESLPAPAAKKRAALFEYVAGTSQKSWLDKFRPPRRLGGKTYERDGTKGQRRELTEEEKQQLAIDLWRPILAGLLHEGLEEGSWAALPARGEISIAMLKGLLIELNRKVPAAE